MGDGTLDDIYHTLQLSFGPTRLWFRSAHSELHDRQIHCGGKSKNRGYGTRNPQKKDNSKDANQSGPTR